VPLPTAEAGGDLADEVRRLAATVEALARSSPPALVPVEEAARALGLSVSTVRRRVKDGAIPSRKLGRALRVDLAGLRPLSREEVVQEARKARAGGTSPVSLVSRRGT
jgi:excisionase family DNA binding protein